MKHTCFLERVSQAYELSHSIFNRTILNIHFDQQKSGSLEPVGEVGKGGDARAPVTPPLPTSLAFLNYFFHFRGVHSRSCIMGNHGKMAGYWKIFIGIQSQLFLPEFIYLIVSLWKELLPSSKKQYTKSEIAKMSVTSFKKTSIFPYIFCHFDTVELQKMYGKKSRFSKNWSQTSFHVSRVSAVDNYSRLLYFYSGCLLSWHLTSITSITSILLLRQQITDRWWRVAGVWEGVFVLIHPRRPRGG